MLHQLMSGVSPFARRLVVSSSAFLLSAGLATAIPWAPNDSENGEGESGFHESPAERAFEDFPASEHLLQAPQPQSVKIMQKAARAGIGIVSGWTFRGPSPIPNGQTVGSTFGNAATENPVNGRVASIAIHPTNPDIAYVGAASGGLYRTTDGGNNWVQLMDGASAPTAGVALSIGSVAIDPSNTSRVFVGTGEGNLSSDSFFGSGFYIITGADTGSPTVSGPFNAASGNDPLGGVPIGSDVFTGRSIVAIAVDPTNANNVYVSTSSGVGGLRNAAYSVLPRRGVYRSQDALSATPHWTRLQVGGTNNNTISSSLVLDPQNPSNLVVAMLGQTAADPSGIYRTTNATAATPAFTQSLALPANSSLVANSKLAAGFNASINGGVTVVYATSSENAPTASSQGKLYKSTDGGTNFTNIPAVNGFAGNAGFYNITVGTGPTNPNNVAVGGQANNLTFERSTDGGTTWTIDPANGPYTISAGLHADVHSIVFAASNSAVVYEGNDGGIFRSTDTGSHWTALNGGGFSAVQYYGLALHPTDPNFTLSGSQDNGTELLRPDSSVTRVDFGDGGYALVDQNAANTTNVVMYHTYYNQTNNFMGTARVLSVPCAVENQWSFHGSVSFGGGPYCDGTSDNANGIANSDTVQFYAPMALGPGNPNTWYFGSSKLYRSTDMANTATAVGTVAVAGEDFTDIAISPQDDGYRLGGTNAGQLYGTANGGTATLISSGGPSTGLFPQIINRVAFDPNNKNIAYVALSGYGVPHLYRTSNFGALATGGSVYFTSISSGLPDVPVDAIAIDPQSGSASRTSTDIYIGTDVGVYRSTDAGATWATFNSNLPRVPVFGLAIQNSSRILRAATHGRGWYDIGVSASAPAAPAMIAAYSRKVHGTAGVFDLDLPLSGQSGIEPRRQSAGGASYTLVVRFTNSLASGSAMVTSGTGTTGPATFSGSDMIIPLSGVTDQQNVTVTLTNVTDTNAQTLPSASVTIGFLTGDVNRDRTVQSADATAVRNNSGATITSANFVDDINCDGFDNSADATIVRNNSGHGPLP